MKILLMFKYYHLVYQLVFHVFNKILLAGVTLSPESSSALPVQSENQSKIEININSLKSQLDDNIPITDQNIIYELSKNRSIIIYIIRIT